jgi:hypothetical protein
MRARIKFNFLLTISSSLVTSQLTLFSEPTDICSENRTKQIKYKLRTKCTVQWLQPLVRVVTTGPYKVTESYSKSQIVLLVTNSGLEIILIVVSQS